MGKRYCFFKRHVIKINTQRLELIPLKIGQFKLLLDNPDKLAKELNLNKPIKKLNEDTKFAMNWLYKQCINYPKHHKYAKTILAETNKDNFASQKVLQKNKVFEKYREDSENYWWKFKIKQQPSNLPQLFDFFLTHQYHN